MSNDTTSPNQSLLTFPCDFTIKVFGTASNEFEASVSQIIRQHIPDLPEGAVQIRQSANSKYSAMSVTVHVTSKEQLDNIYQNLTASPLVLMAL